MENEFDLSMVTVGPEDELDTQKAKLTSGSVYKGVDCCTVLTTTTAAKIKAAGYEFVMRYIGKSSFAKNIKPAELAAIKAAGLMCGFVFETTAGRALSGAGAGATDGAIAKAAADSLGLSESVAIIFAVDTDTSDFDTVEAYGKAFAAALGGRPCGVYGSYKVVEAMKARGACQHFWQTYAWSYGKLSSSAHVYQYKNGQTVGGVSVDLNYAYTTNGFYNSSDGVSELVSSVAGKIGLTSPDYWENALRGTIAANTAYVKAVFERTCKAAGITCTDDTLINKATALLGLTSPDYWQGVITGKNVPPASYLSALFTKINAAV